VNGGGGEEHAELPIQRRSPLILRRHQSSASLSETRGDRVGGRWGRVERRRRGSRPEPGVVVCGGGGEGVAHRRSDTDTVGPTSV
jgi:hypothetical protein